MSVVKGSTPTRLMVVPYRPWYRFVVISSLILGFVVIGLGSYAFGHRTGVSLQTDAIAERDRLRLQLQAQLAESEALSQQVANLKLASEVDKASSEDVRSQVIALKGQIAQLEEDITFYRGLMAPTDNRRGLTIGSVDVIATGVPRQYDFKVVVQQLATSHEVLNGTLTVEVVGQDAGEVKRIPLNQLSSQVDEENIKLRFKYFQNIQGQLLLPEGFEPQRIELVAKSTGRDAVAVEKKFGWLVQES